MPSWHFSTSPSAELSSARLAKQRLTSLFCYRIHAMSQAVEFFNGLLSPLARFAEWIRCNGWQTPRIIRVGSREMNNVLAVVLAGGKGERLEPLTRDRA